VSRLKMIQVPAFVVFTQGHSSFAGGLEVKALEAHGATVIDIPELTNGVAVMVESAEMEWSPATFIGDSQDKSSAIVQNGSGHLRFVDWQKIRARELADIDPKEGGDA